MVLLSQCRIPSENMPNRPIIRLYNVAQSLLNGFPARLLGMREFDRDSEFVRFEDPDGDLRYVQISLVEDTLLGELAWILNGLGIERIDVLNEYHRRIRR